ncbi:ankyrin repeat protein, partial [Diaporthe sp. PMI_573]
QTQLLPAVEMGNKAEAKLLLEKGADPEAKDGSNRTPLSQAARNRHKAVANLEAKDGRGQTPLSSAAASGNEAEVKLSKTSTRDGDP